MSDETQHRRGRFAPRTRVDTPPEQRSTRLSFWLLGVAVALALAVTGWLGVLGYGNEVKLEIQEVRIAETGEVELTGARYRGLSQSGRPYEITAEQANEAQDGSGRVDMVLPTAEITMRNGATVNLRSNSGVFDKSADIVTLAGDVIVIQPGQSLRLDTQALVANLGSGEMRSDVPVEVKDIDRQINANSMQVYNNGSRLVFGGNARMTIRGAPTDAPTTLEIKS
jgi:lipopolysaccharide export system protein LptC